MLYEKRPCQPYCRAPDKRDFQSTSPEKSSEDFYRGYDPLVGVGTAAILMLVMAVITVKSLLRWAIRRWRGRKYTKRLAIEVEKRVSFMEGTVRLSLRNTKETTLATTSSMQQNNPNGAIV